jgi:hypothetical protein
MSSFKCWKLSNVSAKIAVSIFRVNIDSDPDAASTSETLENLYRTTWRYNLEDSISKKKVSG